MHHGALPRGVCGPGDRAVERPVHLEGAPSPRVVPEKAREPARQLGLPRQVEQQRRDVGVGQDDPGRDFLSVRQPDRHRAALADPHALDPRTQPDFAAPLPQAPDQRVGDSARAPFGHGVAPRRGGHGQHEPQAPRRTGRPVRRRRGAPATAILAGPPGCENQRSASPRPLDAKIRPSRAACAAPRRRSGVTEGKGPMSRPITSGSMPRYHSATRRQRSSSRRSSPNAASWRSGSADDRRHAPVGSRMTALDRSPAPVETVALERQRPEGRAERAPGEKGRAHVV